VSDVDWPFRLTDEVRFGDLDAMGHLNNVAFLTFLESARVAYAIAADPGYAPGQGGDLGFVVAEVKIAYRSPGHYGDLIETRIRPTNIGRSSFRADFQMRVGERLLADGHSVLVAISAAAGRPTEIPPALRERLIADGALAR
jgi:acyl-CoA thioester hydrolase